ncbi:hypothetical protein C8R46DRAFT_1080465 [Mycena filopes]|nr:hypothetical protein C8R46DRAFT_1080465 [Mycena filopes]
MLHGQTNDTRYPGLQGRLLHDTVNANPIISQAGLVFSQARVGATLVNVHCSQISDASIATFILPYQSTDMLLARPSPVDGQNRYIFPNFTVMSDNYQAWINVSLPPPPYWNSDLPGLNIVGYWAGGTGDFRPPTGVYFQPWAFEPFPDRPIGHHQLIMVVASGRSAVLDAHNSTGNSVNFTLYPGSTITAQIQVLGCTMKANDLIATIDPQGRLLDPLTSLDELIGPEAPHDDHAWDEFQWESGDNITAVERQFLLGFTPSTPAYNNTAMYPGILGPALTPIGSPESTLAALIDGDVVPLYQSINPRVTAFNSLLNLQSTLEGLYASYLWSLNQLCGPYDHIQPYWESCAGYLDRGLAPAELDLRLPAFTLVVVEWRAILSLLCSLGMWYTALQLVGERPPGKGKRPLQHADGVLDAARMFSRGSRIPKIVAAEMAALGFGSEAEKELLKAALMKRLRYIELDDGVGGHLDVESSEENK